MSRGMARSTVSKMRSADRPHAHEIAQAEPWFSG
jgi:hypothetical protein